MFRSLSKIEMSSHGAVAAPLLRGGSSKQGVPVSIAVFEGNRSDSTTVIEQVEKRVGDKGMIKHTQIQVFTQNTHDITSILEAHPRANAALHETKIAYP